MVNKSSLLVVWKEHNIFITNLIEYSNTINGFSPVAIPTHAKSTSVKTSFLISTCLFSKRTRTIRCKIILLLESPTYLEINKDFYIEYPFCHSFNPLFQAIRNQLETICEYLELADQSRPELFHLRANTNGGSTNHSTNIRAFERCTARATGPRST